MFVKAKVIALKTADGLMEFKGFVQVGKVYEVDPETRRTAQFFNTEKGVLHVKEIVDVDNGRWLPTELLQLQVS